MKTLDQEKFDTVKELADMQMSISLGRAELKKIMENTEEYIVLREKKAEERVIKVLEKSRNALEETTNNHKELSAYNRELQVYASDIKDLAKHITTLFQDFNKRMTEAEKSIETHYKTSLEVINQAKIERVQIAEDRKQLKREKVEMREQTKLLKDRRAALERAWDELKAKQK